eukprot:NODE_160_length_16633_cov_0.230132.p5 type:complete len:330 gc:universal NODE_160_length_16633_cov_0.230132:4973-3984(-)
MSVLIETTVGNFVIDLYLSTDLEKSRPGINFIKLCKFKKFHFNSFYSVERNWIQTGDPNNDGSGGCCFEYYNDESDKKFMTVNVPKVKHDRYTVSFSSPHTKLRKAHITSQFFICLDNPCSFDGTHVPFGVVAEGQEVVDKIAKIPTKNGSPMTSVYILHTVILDDPYEDSLTYPSSPTLPEHVQKAITFSYDDIEILDEDEQEVENAEKSAKTLEILGDIPFSNLKPAENNLFICKLNPITVEDDLKLLFGRFGEILQCKIVRDKQGISKGYCFMEFNTKQACEQAYVKMNNVIIDERRIKIDFSQNTQTKNWRLSRQEERPTKKFKN